MAAVSLALAASLDAQYRGWLIPPGGQDEKSPLTAGADVLQQGQVLFRVHCVRCHGVDGTGNGPDSDHADGLTDDLRSELNSEGVLFYKIRNGHAIQLRGQIEDMPALNNTLTPPQVWALGRASEAAARA